jgi:hypothetical protein
VRRRGGIAAPFKATGVPSCDRRTVDVAPRYTRPALVGTRSGVRELTVARNTTRSRHARGSGKARATSGTRVGGTERRGGGGPRRGATSLRGRALALHLSDCHTSSTFFSQNLNTSAQSDE